MITIRPSEERGKAYLGWLDSKHTFSFGSYYDPNYMGFASLRVINEDKISPTQGFNTHSHQNMEIITYVLEGELEHKDSIGNGSIIRPGDVQRMSAGRGIAHSEFNPSSQETVHLLQIWIQPNQIGVDPSYEQKYFAHDEKQGKLRLIASEDGREGSVKIHQDASLYVTLLGKNEEIKHNIPENRSLWLQIVRGSGKINGHIVNVGDGVAITQEKKLDFIATEDNTEILLFDLA
ncbi:pirin family protein [Cyanobacterium sp. Dongsha4]|uniref:pirin family protein n=1 Tax=Cyanobacterium sp. DS4 TaxID=2878255 RepID=UPI002E80EDC1|nr:pirin family protein [Cyanobacterium sp. Dongsha4]WVL00074.1 pirin family protein [Cyanobacterium sp. Dongsha4]